MSAQLQSSPGVGITYHKAVVQGSDEWRALRCGLITASEMGLLLTPTLKVADNDKSRAHVYELLAQRITRYVEPAYVGSDMLRGDDEEILAREAYSKHYAPLTEVGFVTNDKFGFTLGYSPDGLQGSDGLFEAKSRMQKHQVRTLIENKVPDEHVLQLQTGLLVTERKWIDFASYCGGLPMAVIRVLPDPVTQAAILTAAHRAELAMAEMLEKYTNNVRGLVATERRDYTEMFT